MGAVLAVALGGSVARVADASLGSGARNVFVPITPCRLFDTRPGTDNVGPKSSPLGPGETFTVQARGPQGKCNLPADATGLSLNVAVIGGTAASFLTVFPAGTDLPLAANLNWVANQPPTPNKVDVGVSGDGKVSFYNLAGSVHVAADVSGYYVDHTFDDRYYTKAEMDAALAAKAAKPTSGRYLISPDELSALVVANDVTSVSHQSVTGITRQCLSTPVRLPDGAVATKVTAIASYGPGGNFKLEIARRAVDPVNGVAAPEVLATKDVGAGSFVSVGVAPIPMDNSTYAYTFTTCLTVASFYGAVIEYTMP